METANLRDARLVLGSRVTKNAPLIGRSRLLLINLGKKSFGETLPGNQKDVSRKLMEISWKTYYAVILFV